MANDLQVKISSMVGNIQHLQGKIDGISDAVIALNVGIETQTKAQSVYVNGLFGLIFELINEAIQSYNKGDGRFTLNTPNAFDLVFDGLVTKLVSGIPVSACYIEVIIPVDSIKMRSGESIGKTEAILMCGDQFLDLNRIIEVHINKVFQQNGIDSNLFSFIVKEKFSLD